MTNLFGETPESRSIAILREFEPPEGYWLADSGGATASPATRSAAATVMRAFIESLLLAVIPGLRVLFRRGSMPGADSHVWDCST